MKVASKSSGLKSPIFWLTNFFGTNATHDPFLLTSIMMVYTLLDPPGYQIFLLVLFQKLVQIKVLDGSPASDLSELVDNDSLRHHDRSERHAMERIADVEG